MSAYMQENVATMAISAALTLGLYWLGAGNHSFWGLVLLLNLNYVRRGK